MLGPLPRIPSSTPIPESAPRPGRPPIPTEVWETRFKDALEKRNVQGLSLPSMAKAIGSNILTLRNVLERAPNLSAYIVHTSEIGPDPEEALPGGPQPSSRLPLSERRDLVERILEHAAVQGGTLRAAWQAQDPSQRVPMSEVYRASRLARSTTQAPAAPTPASTDPMEALASLSFSMVEAPAPAHEPVPSNLGPSRSQEERTLYLQEKMALMDERRALLGQCSDLQSEVEDLKLYASLRDADNERLSNQNTDLSIEVDRLRVNLSETESLLMRTQDDLQTWLLRTAHLRASAKDSAWKGLPPTADVTPENLLIALEGSKSLEAGLHALEKLYQNRVTILPSAFKSAREWGHFKRPEMALSLLVKLATTFLDAALEGRDPAREGIFTTEAYAANESPATLGVPEFRKARTFVYNGEPTLFEAHLKIGVANDPTKMWRCHFKVDHENRRVVIAHSGAHIPTAHS